MTDSNKIAFIAGASCDIGAAVARRLAADASAAALGGADALVNWDVPLPMRARCEEPQILVFELVGEIPSFPSTCFLVRAAMEWIGVAQRRAKTIHTGTVIGQLAKVSCFP